jgi:hypothetical protein
MWGKYESILFTNINLQAYNRLHYKIWQLFYSILLPQIMQTKAKETQSIFKLTKKFQF